jgi:hypothetical protein
VQCGASKQAVNLSVHQDGGLPVPGFQKYWTQNLASLTSECHAIMNKYPEALSVLQKVYKVLSDIENLGRCTLAKVGESSEWTYTVKSMEEKRANFVKV